MTEFPQKLLTDFMGWVDISIDEKGIYPYPCFMHKRDKEGLIICALDLTPEQCLQHFWHHVSLAKCTAIIMGFDRYTKPGQGTELKDLLSVFMWYDDPDQNVWNTVKYGIIEYQHEPRIVKPLNFDNAHWNEQLVKELRQTRPETCVRVKHG